MNMREAKSTSAKNLKTLLVEMNITHQELADILGVTRQAISQYADGTAVPNVDKLCKMAFHFGVTTDYLLGLSKYKNEERKINYEEIVDDIIEELSEWDDLGFGVLCGLRDTIQLINHLQERSDYLPDIFKVIIICFCNVLNKYYLLLSGSGNAKDYFNEFLLGYDIFVSTVIKYRDALIINASEKETVPPEVQMILKKWCEERADYGVGAAPIVRKKKVNPNV